MAEGSATRPIYVVRPGMETAEDTDVGLRGKTHELCHPHAPIRGAGPGVQVERLASIRGSVTASGTAHTRGLGVVSQSRAQSHVCCLNRDGRMGAGGQGSGALGSLPAAALTSTAVCVVGDCRHIADDAGETWPLAMRRLQPSLALDWLRVMGPSGAGVCSRTEHIDESAGERLEMVRVIEVCFFLHDEGAEFPPLLLLSLRS